jgi:hypothetical protein
MQEQQAIQRRRRPGVDEGAMTVSYESDARRLRLGGVLGEEHVETVRDAVVTFGKVAAGCLTVDLTAVTELDAAVARYLVEAKALAESEGSRMPLLRKLDTPADHALNAATDSAADRDARSRPSPTP